MLSIAKLRVGQEAYHLSGVAQSLDEYSTGLQDSHPEVFAATGSVDARIEQRF